jgi:Cu/Ag efflux protein CusF
MMSESLTFCANGNDTVSPNCRNRKSIAMKITLNKMLLASTLAAAMAVGLANAAEAPRVGVRGAITAIDGDALHVKVNSGEEVTVHLTQATQVRAVTLAKIDEIKPGSYIGSAAMPNADGTLTALEVHVFPPVMAGTGDGHRAFDLKEGSSMTNGTVGDLVVSKGRTLTVKYKGGEQKIVVPEDVPIVNLEPGDRSLLKPGVKVVLFSAQGADGKITAQAISAGKGGVTPPM